MFSSIVASTLLLRTAPAHALVKGNAPPPNMKPSGEKLKCTNVEECQAMAERKQSEESSLKIQGPPPKVSKGGTRYIDMDIGDESKSPVKDGDEVTIYYKVLKLGKRSYDGLSGEGTVVFSSGTAKMMESLWKCFIVSLVRFTTHTAHCMSRLRIGR
jgi:hypothetical protein